MNQHQLLGFKQYKKYMVNAIIKNVIILTLPILLYFVLEIPGIVLGMAISNLLASLPFFRKLKIRNFSDIKNHYKVIIHNFGVDLTILVFIVDKLLIVFLFGYLTVGIYQFNLQILFALSTLPTVLNLFLLSEESSGETHKKISYLVIFGSIVLAVTAIVLSPILVNEFFPKYSEGIFSLQILVLALIPMSISAIFSAKLMAKESTRIGFSSLVLIGTTLVLMALLGQLYGLVGLSLAVLSSNIILTFFLYILYLKQKN